MKTNFTPWSISIKGPLITAFGILLGIVAAFPVQAQEIPIANAPKKENVFRKGYIRVGISQFPENEMNFSQSPIQNLENGQFGASTGYVFELGRNYYFNKKGSGIIKYGLDWTIISANYAELDWTAYAADRQQIPISKEAFHYFSISSKLGPVISIKAVEALVIDLRAQVGIGMHAMLVDYYEGDTDYITMVGGDNPLDSASEPSIYPSFGVTLRRKAIGLAVDYFKQTVSMKYETESIEYGNVDIPIATTQVKLVFSFK